VERLPVVLEMARMEEDGECDYVPLCGKGSPVDYPRAVLDEGGRCKVRARLVIIAGRIFPGDNIVIGKGEMAAMENGAGCAGRSGCAGVGLPNSAK
jgi:hypothetical protein